MSPHPHPHPAMMGVGGMGSGGGNGIIGLGGGGGNYGATLGGYGQSQQANDFYGRAQTGKPVCSSLSLKLKPSFKYLTRSLYKSPRLEKSVYICLYIIRLYNPLPRIVKQSKKNWEHSVYTCQKSTFELEKTHVSTPLTHTYATISLYNSVRSL